MNSIQDAVVKDRPLDVAVADGEISVKGGSVDCRMTPLAALETAHRIILAANRMRAATA